MNLTSVDHVKYYLTINDEAFQNDHNTLRKLVQLVPSISSAIANYCNRDFELKSRVEYFETIEGKKTFFVTSFPVESITSVYSDSQGLFAGSETLEVDYFPSARKDAIVLSTPVSPNERGLKATYIGGLAAHPTRTVITLSPGHDTFAVNKFIHGCSSYTFGKIIAFDAISHTITVDIYYGIFQLGEELSQQDAEFQNSEGNIMGSLASFQSRALCELYPDLVTACEMEIRYIRQHLHDFENAGTNKDGTTLRRTPYFSEYNFQPETLGILNKYRRIGLL